MIRHNFSKEGLLHRVGIDLLAHLNVSKDEGWVFAKPMHLGSFWAQTSTERVTCCNSINRIYFVIREVLNDFFARFSYIHL